MGAPQERSRKKGMDTRYLQGNGGRAGCWVRGQGSTAGKQRRQAVQAGSVPEQPQAEQTGSHRPGGCTEQLKLAGA
jgi:hypothetical protein